jgi:tRNA(Ile)-lysidine synthase
MPSTQDTFLHEFRNFVRGRNLINHGDRIIVSVSGGVDSVALLDMLRQLQKEWNLELAVAHFNHQLRGKESDADEQFVYVLAKQLELQCFVERAATKSIAEAKKISPQEAARELRYTFWTKLRYSLGFHSIATAHHADDNAETMLFNLIRGTGIHGMSGIPVVRKDLAVIRPLLFANRSQILEYVTARNLNYREDSSNVKIEYTRNFLRHQIIPLLKENINPNVTASLLRTSELFDNLEQYLESVIAEENKTVLISSSSAELVYSISELHKKSLFIQEYLLYRSLKDFVEAEIVFSTVKSILQLSQLETGSSISLANGVSAFRDRERLIIKYVESSPSFEYHINIGKYYAFNNYCFNSSLVNEAQFSADCATEYVDAEKLSNELILRQWHDGDWFIPLGMKEKKKLSDFFIEQKVPICQKHSIPLLESDGNIVWVCGYRLDERFKVTTKTKKIAKFVYQPQQRNT